MAKVAAQARRLTVTKPTITNMDMLVRLLEILLFLNPSYLMCPMIQALESVQRFTRIINSIEVLAE